MAIAKRTNGEQNASTKGFLHVESKIDPKIQADIGMKHAEYTF